MSNTITTSAPTFTFSNDADTGFFSNGDQIMITSGGRAVKTNYKKVHVARRRNAKKLSRPAVWKIVNTSPTTLTVTIDP